VVIGAGQGRPAMPSDSRADTKRTQEREAATLRHRLTRADRLAEARREYADAMRARRLVPPQDGIVADGKIHKCDVADKRPGKGDGRYAFYPNKQVPGGWFINWSDGRGVQNWHYTKGGRLSAADRREVERTVKAGRKQRAEHHIEARAEAEQTWRNGKPVPERFAYCVRKQVKPHGLRFNRAKVSMIVPMYDEDDQLQSVEQIYADGTKLFLKGGRVSGSHFWVETPEKAPNEGTICITEGWVTGESVFDATNFATIIAFAAGNLVAVAQWVRERYPDHRIIICADDDWQTKGNPGLMQAAEAAIAVNGLIAIPKFGADRGEKDSDFNDLMIAQGLDAVQAAIEAAEDPMERAAEAENEDEDGADGDGVDRKQADLLIHLASRADLFHSGDDGFADISVNGHRETWPIRSRSFKSWLARQYYKATKGAPNPTTMASALQVIEAKAKYDSPAREVFLRVAGYVGRIYLDLGDADWQVVEIDTEGWRIVSDPPIRFHRRRGTRALPVPARGGKIETLRKYLNIRTKDGFILVVAWLLAALRDRGPYPVYKVVGEAGSAKSTLLKVLHRLVDPNAAELRAPPQSERDLFVAANNAHVLAYDNLSWLPDWLSDGLARLSTGGSFAARTLYENDEETLFTATRPILLGAIENVVVRGDLADRSVSDELQPIAEGKHRLESEFWATFERDRPAIFGALLDAVAHGLRRLPHVNLARLPRMADFMQWAVACGDGLLWEAGAFARAYESNRSGVTRDVVEADPVATALLHLMNRKPRWTGTATELLEDLETIVGEKEAHRKQWPGSAAGLGRRLMRIATPLRRLGIEVARDREGHGRERVISITKVPDVPSAPSARPMARPLKTHTNINADGADSADSKSERYNIADGTRRSPEADYGPHARQARQRRADAARAAIAGRQRRR
jgi:phage/plasmid primase-like uncharacterized protein